MDTQFEAYRRQYTDTLTHLYELDRPYLIDGMKIDTDIEGSTKVFSRIGQLKAHKKTGRNEVAKLSEPEYSARHLRVSTWYVATPVDKEDVEKMVTDPTSDIYTEAVHTIYDSQTQEAMNGFFADVVVGENGGSTSQFPAANQVAANYSGGPFLQNTGAVDVGLNMDKMLKIRSMIAAQGKVKFNTTSMNTLNIGVTENDCQSFLANKIGTDNYPMANLDFGMTLYKGFEKAVENIEGGMFRWHGFTFHVVPDEYFLLDSNGDRRLPVWIKDGMVYGLKKAVDTEVVKLPASVESTKIQALTRVGALRKHDGKVFEIKVKV